MNVLTASEVVCAFVNASNPAFLAHATRKLNKYVAERVKEGKNEVQTRAAIKAHVTMHKQKWTEV